MQRCASLSFVKMNENILSRDIRTPNLCSHYYAAGANKPEERCPDRVFASRAAATEVRSDKLSSFVLTNACHLQGGKAFSVGVIPTVSLGAALLIFFGVGMFAAGIAQAFQMVSTVSVGKEKTANLRFIMARLIKI